MYDPIFDYDFSYKIIKYMFILAIYMIIYVSYII